MMGMSMNYRPLSSGGDDEPLAVGTGEVPTSKESRGHQ